MDYINSASFPSLTSKEISEEIINNISTTFDFKCCSIYLINETTKQFELNATYAVSEKDCHHLENENLMLNSNVEQDLFGLRRLSNMDWVYITPMMHNNQACGVLALVHPKKGYFKDGVTEYLAQIANVIAFKFDEAETQRKIEIKDLELLDLQQLRIKAELSALRAQMNLHFLFNTLNSINWFIIKNKPIEASRYLTKFSKLVRTILDNSKQPLISLDRELESLKLYIDLESIRFEGKFESTIEVEKSINQSSLLIPPLIFQPFVENAIWHGLMHKKETGLLLINILQSNNILECSILDNGVGRDFTAKIKQSKKTNQKSQGINITRERILILDPSLKNPVCIEDLKNGKGESTGTKVILSLPILLSKKEEQHSVQ